MCVPVCVHIQTVSLLRCLAPKTEIIPPTCKVRSRDILRMGPTWQNLERSLSIYSLAHFSRCRRENPYPTHATRFSNVRMLLMRVYQTKLFYYPCLIRRVCLVSKRNLFIIDFKVLIAFIFTLFCVSFAFLTTLFLVMNE